MTPDEIRIEFIKQGKHISMAQIGRNIGVSQQAVQRVIERDSTSMRIMIAVAAAIGMSPEDVFPDHKHKFKNQPV
jgi:lambda repressor-like predicted transcriptional regulator